MNDITRTGRALFGSGLVVTTPGVLEQCPIPRQLECLRQHLVGSWGCIDDEDRATNDDARANGGRILSAYPIDPNRPSKGYGDNTLWIITEADRSATTLLLPDEY
jgi:hypothetical protein